jgi:hypothetical protein
MIHEFDRTRVIYEISAFIRDQRSLLLDDLVAYTKDPVRYKRRIRMLVQLAEYEKQILEKIRDFETDDPADFEKYLTVALLKEEVRHVTDLSA